MTVLAVQQTVGKPRPLSEEMLILWVRSSSPAHPTAAGTTSEDVEIAVEVVAGPTNKIGEMSAISNERAVIARVQTILFGIVHKDSVKPAETGAMIGGLNNVPIINPDYMVRNLRFTATKIPRWS